MGKPFLTERQIEAQLELESRTLPLPGGRLESVTQFRLIWTSYDLALRYLPLSPVAVSAIVLSHGKRRRLPFAEALRDVVVVLRQRANSVMQARLEALNRKLGPSG